MNEKINMEDKYERERYYIRNSFGMGVEVRDKRIEEMEMELTNKEKEMEEGKILKTRYNKRYREISLHSNIGWKKDCGYVYFVKREEIV